MGHERELTARAVEMTEVARQLRLMRHLAGLTYAQLARATGLSTAQLHRAANGYRTPWPVVEKFSRGCGVDPRAVQEHWREAMAAPESVSFGLDRVRGITTFDELREAMQELLRASGLSLRELSQRAPAGTLPRTTLNEALRGKARLRKDLVLAFVGALRLGSEQEAAWSDAWKRASLNKSVRQQVVQVLPSPHLLRALSEIDMPEWNCLAELVDSALDGQSRQAHGTGTAEGAPLEVSITFHRDAERHCSAIVIRDQGAGMDRSELLDSVRLNWAGGGRSLSGFGFNIATRRLGSVVTVRTARREDTAWSVLSLDLRALARDTQWRVQLRVEPKQRQDEHGTEITISELRDPRPRHMRRLRDRLGDVYSYLIREDRLRLTLDEYLVSPRLPCAWDAARRVQLREGPVAARQEVDVTLATVQQCQACGASASFDADMCGECGSRRLIPLARRVWGWLGIQRYLHPTDYGIDFYRHGRKILARDKSLFAWTDDDTGTVQPEYPADLPNQGRIIGEIHCDHVPVSWSKDSFATDSSPWRGVVHVIRGQGPLSTVHGQRLGYPVNTSPLAVLFRAYRRNDPGLRWLVPGDGQRAIHEQTRQWGQAFHRLQPEFQSDQVWYDAAAAHDAHRLRPAREGQADPASPALFEQLQQEARGSNATGHSRSPRAPQTVVRCEYLFEREARTNKDGRVSYRATGQRLRVSNIGTGPADHLRIGIEPVGDGTCPVILNARGDGSVLEVGRLLGRTHVDFPVARTWGTAPTARLTANWEEDGVKFQEIQSISWS
ncbi:XRE family transcriptional regulator [Streptomyces sp. NPDC056486]|uniref:XRE family transcriptional regulator n=1 Tax=Streptomyces sp. NPDC056486 TaxID=3345835 RepID=UPI003684063D